MTSQVCSRVFDSALCRAFIFREEDDRWASASVSNLVGTSIVGRDNSVRGVSHVNMSWRVRETRLETGLWRAYQANIWVYELALKMIGLT